MSKTSNPFDIMHILPLTQRVVLVQNLVAGVPEEVIASVLPALKQRIEAAPVGSDTTQMVFMLRAIEHFEEYRGKLLQFLEDAAKEGLFTEGDGDEYERILRNISGPGTDTKQ